MKRMLLLGIVISLSFLNLSEAGTTSWSYSDYSHGTFVPKRGSFTESVVTTTEQYTTRVSFQLDSYNVAQIKDYNNGGENPGGPQEPNCDGSQAYFTVDIRAVPDSWDLEIDALTVVSNLPNPKFDVEDNNFFGENDESETVALDTVASGTSYYMKTYWGDYRDGDDGDSGMILVDFSMSDKGFSDYNVCQPSSGYPIENPYNDDKGSF